MRRASFLWRWFAHPGLLGLYGREKEREEFQFERTRDAVGDFGSCNAVWPGCSTVAAVLVPIPVMFV